MTDGLNGASLKAPPVHPRRLAYLGSPALAVPPLQALVAAGFEVALVVSEPDRRRGRGSTLSPTPVKTAALDLGIDVSSEVDDVLGVGADLGVVVAFGRLIRRPILTELAMVNLHFSLLPRWRGAAPVERAILAGDAETGACVMGLEEGLDTGPVYACRRVTIHDEEPVDALFARLVETGSRLMVDTLTAGLADPEQQQGDYTYAEKLQPDEFKLRWERSTRELAALVRLGRAHTSFRGERLKILRAVAGPNHDPTATMPSPGTVTGELVATGDGWLRLVEVQPAGRRAQPVDAWLRGIRMTDSEHME